MRDLGLLRPAHVRREEQLPLDLRGEEGLLRVEHRPNERIARGRSAADRWICALRSADYAVRERLQLRWLRARREADYADPEETPLVSVYIPTYNRAAILLERAVPTVLAQSYARFELIVVGDCCTDDTEARVRALADPRVRFISTVTREGRYPDEIELHWLAGPVAAANVALRAARGKWIARIDDDDTWSEDHLEKLLRFAQRGGHEFVSSQCETLRDGERQLCPGIQMLDPYFTRQPMSPAAVQSPRVGATQTWLYRSYLRFMRYNPDCWRKEWNRVNDIDLITRMFRAGVRMGFLEEVLAYILPRPGETAVGLDAYRARRAAMAEHFRFPGMSG